MKTDNYSENPEGRDHNEFSNTELSLEKLQHQVIDLETFSLTGLLKEVIADFGEQQNRVQIQDSDVVMVNTDKKLVRLAVVNIISALINKSKEVISDPSLTVRIKLSGSVGIINFLSNNGDLHPISSQFTYRRMTEKIRSLSDEYFGIYLAYRSLIRIKGKLDILSPLGGKSEIIVQLPNIRGQAS